MKIIFDMSQESEISMVKEIIKLAEARRNADTISHEVQAQEPDTRLTPQEVTLINTLKDGGLPASSMRRCCRLTYDEFYRALKTLKERGVVIAHGKTSSTVYYLSSSCQKYAGGTNETHSNMRSPQQKSGWKSIPETR